MATKIQKTTAERMIAKLQAELDRLYEMQESMKTPADNRGIQPEGALQEMPLGGLAKLKPNFSSLVDTTKLKTMATNTLSPKAGFGTKLRMGFDNLLGGMQNNDWANKIGTAAPMLYNVAQGMQKPEQMTATDFHNPMAGQALSSMQARRFDVNPALRQNEAAFQTAGQNIRNVTGGSRGAYLSNMGAAMQGTQTNAANILSQGQNMNAQYQGELAQMQAGLGQQAAQTNLQVADMNAANRAAQRNYMGQAMSDVSGMTQTNRLMDNQMMRDEQLMSLLPDMYGSVYPFMKNLQNINVRR